MLIGLGFILLTVVKLERLSNAPHKTKRYIIASLILILAGGFSLSQLWTKDKALFERKAAIAEINNTYYNNPNIDITKNDISLTHIDESIACLSIISIKNNTKQDLKKYIISLNPGLIIENITANKKPLKYIRKENIIEITDNISTGGEKIISIKYSGHIDEAASFTDIQEKVIKEKITYSALNIPKKYSFLRSDYVLLTPESNWYPTAGLAYNPKKPSIGRYRFTDYSLKVKTKEGLTALSQGEMSTLKDGTFLFKSEHKLTQISLLIGEYEKQEIKVDSITYSIHFKKGHDYYTPFFEEIRDTLPSLIHSMMSDYELKQRRNYPYKRLMIVEAPAQFFSYSRLWTNHNETVQPEMVFVPELALTLPDADFERRFKRMRKWRKRNDANVKDKDLKSEMFNRNMYNIFLTDEKVNKFDWSGMNNIFAGTELNTKIYSLYPNFYTFTNNIYSNEYPIVGGVVENLTKDETAGRGSWWMSMLGGVTTQEKANLALKGKTLEEVLANVGDYEETLEGIMQNKADFFKALVNAKIGKKQLRKELTSFYDNNMYKNVDIKKLLAVLNAKYGLDLDSQVDAWYNASSMPGYKIDNIEGYTVKDGDELKYQIKISISNLEPVDGMINLKINLKGSGGRRQARAKRQANALEFSYLIKGNTSYEIGILTSKKPIVFTVNTIISKNIPSKITQRFENFDESDAEPFNGIKEVKKKNTSKVIIVDNEDEGFKIIQNIKEKRLKRYLSSTTKDEKNKYKKMMPWNPPSKWTLFTKEGQYGKYIRSAYYARANENNKKAVWTANIKEAGYYEVYFFYNTNVWNYNRRSNKQRSSTIYKIKVIGDGQTTDLDMDLDGDNDKGWFSLGSYYFPEGDAKLELSDKTGSRSIVADAVKWIKKD
jgi:hypothetical protein